MDKPKKTQVDTPRKGAWYTQVNRRGFVPQKAEQTLKYTVKSDDEWTQKVGRCQASVDLHNLLFAVESKVGNSSSRYCSSNQLIEQLDDLNGHIHQLTEALDYSKILSDTVRTGDLAVQSYSATSQAGPVVDLVSSGVFHTHFEPLRMHLVSQHDDGSETSGYAELGKLQQRMEQAESVIRGWLAVAQKIKECEGKVRLRDSPGI